MFYHIKECLWHHIKAINSINVVLLTACSYTGVHSVESLVFCTLLYIAQSTEFEIFFTFSHRGNDDYEVLQFNDFQ